MISADRKLESYAFDALSIETEDLKSSLSEITSSHLLIKILADVNTAHSLFRDFSCQFESTLVFSNPSPDFNLYSSVLTEEDYRLRPLSENQLKQF